MPIPIIVAKIVAAAPKIIAVASAAKSVKGAIGGGKKKAESRANNERSNAFMNEMLAKKGLGKMEYDSKGKLVFTQTASEIQTAQQILTKPKMQNTDEQINDTTTGSDKGFLGLQTVEAGKKQQTKIIMIAGGIILLLFFFMKKK